MLHFIKSPLTPGFVLTTNGYALTWETSPDNNVSGSPETILTLGVSDVGKGEWDYPAAEGIFGMSANLGSGFIRHTVTLWIWRCLCRGHYMRGRGSGLVSCILELDMLK